MQHLFQTPCSFTESVWLTEFFSAVLSGRGHAMVPRRDKDILVGWLAFHILMSVFLWRHHAEETFGEGEVIASGQEHIKVRGGSRAEGSPIRQVG